MAELAASWILLEHAAQGGQLVGLEIRLPVGRVNPETPDITSGFLVE